MEIQFGYSDEICYVICLCLSYEQYVYMNIRHTVLPFQTVECT